MVVGLEVNTEKTKYMVMSHHQNAGQNHNLLTANKTFKNLATFKCLGMTVINQHLILEEIKSKLNSMNACYRSATNFCLPLSSPKFKHTEHNFACLIWV